MAIKCIERCDERCDEFGVIRTCSPKYSNCQLCRYKDYPQNSDVCTHCIKNNKGTEYYI